MVREYYSDDLTWCMPPLTRSPRLQDPFSVLAELACMLLANLTRVGRSVGWILQPPPPVPSDAQGPGGFLPPLVRAFVAGRRFNNKTDYHFLGAVLANVSQVCAGHEWLF